MNPIRKGESVTLSITDLNNLGCGVGRHPSDGRVIFVKGAVTGDTVRAQIIKVNQSYCVARLEEVLTPSPHRGEDGCAAPLACGGCVYRHITYEHELSLKQGYVQNAFRKAGLPDVTVLPVRTTGRIFGYRNKGQYPVVRTKNGIRAGFYASKSHHIIPADTCMIQNPAFAPIVRFLCDFAERAGWSVYDEESGKGLLRHIYLRIGEKTGELMVCPVVTEPTLPRQDAFVRELTEAFPNVVSLMLNVNRENTNVVLGKEFICLSGQAFIEDELCGLRFRIAPDSFYQVNRDGAELLYELARQAAGMGGSEVLMDLYCGTGTIGLSMAKDARTLRGVEIVSSAVACAKENAAHNGVKNAEFFCADAGDRQVIVAAAGGVRPDVVVIDPPRKGSTRELVDCLASLGVPKIVYVSCDPDTLARDCVWFQAAGYAIGEVTPVDLFPRTGHVESVVCLTRSKK